MNASYDQQSLVVKFDDGQLTMVPVVKPSAFKALPYKRRICTATLLGLIPSINSRAFARRVSWLVLFLLTLSCTHRPRVGGMTRPPDSDGVWEPIEGGQCLELLPEQRFHRVRICETIQTYAYSIVGNKQALDKRVFQRRLRKAITSLVRHTAYPLQKLATAEVEVWFTSPIFEPDKTQITAVVLAPGGNFAIRLPIDSHFWDPTTKDMMVLGHHTYPSRKALQPGVVVVQMQPTAIKDTTLSYLKQLPHLHLDSMQWPVIKIQTPAFAEADLMARIHRTFRQRNILQTVTVLPAGEPEAARGLAFRFPLNPQPGLNSQNDPS